MGFLESIKSCIKEFIKYSSECYDKNTYSFKSIFEYNIFCRENLCLFLSYPKSISHIDILYDLFYNHNCIYISKSEEKLEFVKRVLKKKNSLLKVDVLNFSDFNSEINKEYSVCVVDNSVNLNLHDKNKVLFVGKGCKVKSFLFLN